MVVVVEQLWPWLIFSMPPPHRLQAEPMKKPPEFNTPNGVHNTRTTSPRLADLKARPILVRLRPKIRSIKAKDYKLWSFEKKAVDFFTGVKATIYQARTPKRLVRCLQVVIFDGNAKLQTFVLTGDAGRFE